MYKILIGFRSRLIWSFSFSSFYHGNGKLVSRLIRSVGKIRAPEPDLPD